LNSIYTNRLINWIKNDTQVTPSDTPSLVSRML
jgi:hypothetical protein